MTFGDVTSAVGKGVVAGAAGTAAITASMAIASKLKGETPSPGQAEAVRKVFGVQPSTEAGKTRLAQAVHWAYGSGWGAALGLLAASGLRLPEASALHFGAIFGAGLALLPGLKLAPPVTKWEREAIALDAFHHVLYAATAALAYRYLDQRFGRTAAYRRGIFPWRWAY